MVLATSARGDEMRVATPCSGRWPRLAQMAGTGGSLVLAGMLAPQAAEVAQSYRPWFDIGPVAEREGWTLLAGRRRPE